MNDWRDKAYELFQKNWNKTAVAATLGLPRKTVSDFLNKNTHLGWWFEKEGNTKEGPKFLFMDLETAPTLGYVWGRFKQHLSQDQIKQEGYVLCWAAKWADSDNIMFDRISQPEDDEAIIKSMWNLLDEADIVCCHNALGFDIPTLNARFAYYGMLPPSPYKVVDTLQIAKKVFKFPSNRLESLAHYLNVDRKMKHSGFDLWVRVMRGDEDAWQEMEEYNRTDVKVLEQVYMKLRAWDKRHPNVGLYYKNQEQRCTVCGSDDLKPNGDSMTGLSVFPAYQCNECGHIVRSRVRSNSLKGVMVNG